MKIRTVLYLMIGAIVVSVLSIVYNANRAVLDQPVALWHGISRPVWACVILASIGSMLVPLLFGLVRDARKFFGALSTRQKQHAAQEAENCYVRGVEAMLNRIEELLSSLGRPPRSEKKHHLAIRQMLAKRHLDEGRPREAIGLLRRLIRMEPAFAPAHLKLGKALQALGQPESAVEAWEEGWRATGHPIFLTTIEDHYLREEQPGRALEALKSAVWKSRDDILPRFFLGKLYLRLEMLDEALAEFARMKGRVAH